MKPIKKDSKYAAENPEAKKAKPIVLIFLQANCV